MLRTTHPQLTLWESILPECCLGLPGDLAEIDELLDDDRFFEPFRPFFDPVMGRPSIPIETPLPWRALQISLNHLIKNQKCQAHGYRTWAGFRGQILWAFGEAVDPDTGEIKPLRSVPRGLGANWVQPSFA